MEPQNGVESRDVWTTPGYLDQRHPLLEYLVWYSKTRTLKRTDADRQTLNNIGRNFGLRVKSRSHYRDLHGSNQEINK